MARWIGQNAPMNDKAMSGADGGSLSLAQTALLVIDVQMAFVHMDDAGTPRSTPGAESNIARLLAAFREAGGRVVHIHHHLRRPHPIVFRQIGSVGVFFTAVTALF